MKRDEYTPRQAARDAEYEREYRAWFESLPADQQHELKRQGLASPMVARYGNGAADHDMADSPLASHEPDIAALVDHELQTAPEPVMQDTAEILRHLVADLLSEANTRLTIECLALALGLSAYNGESRTDISKRHGITRAAVSKRCVDITERLNLPPSRAMRSVGARKIYRRSQLKRNRNSKP